MIDRAHAATDRELAKMEKHLSQIYQRASKEIGETWKAYLAEVAEEIQPLQDAYDAAKKSGDKDAIRKAGKKLSAAQRDKTLMDKHYKQMTEQFAKELTNVNKTAIEYINGKLPAVYALNYNHSATEIEFLTENAISFELVNKRAVENLVKAGDKNLLPTKKLDPTKDIPWNMKKVNSEVLQGIVQGESIPKIAKRLKNVTNASEGSAVRAARTIVNGAENKARHDAAENAASKGVIMGKCWVATNDNRTRDWHAQAWADYGDKSNAVPIDDPFIVNGEEMMYPGDKSASASNVYNCRCSHKNVVKGFTSILPPEKRGKIKVTFT